MTRVGSMALVVGGVCVAVAYILHPVGYVADVLIFKPAHWIGHWSPLRPFFGHDER